MVKGTENGGVAGMRCTYGPQHTSLVCRWYLRRWYCWRRYLRLGLRTVETTIEAELEGRRLPVISSTNERWHAKDDGDQQQNRQSNATANVGGHSHAVHSFTL
jgi:hypothetical protein